MSEDATRKQVVEKQGQRDQPAEAVKTFVKPALTRHESLPRVTAQVVGPGSP